MYIWEQKFKNFDEARKFQQGQGFSGKRWKQSQLEILSTCKYKIQRNLKLPRQYTSRYKDFLYIIKKYFKNKYLLNVVDFGGGIGVGYYYLRQNLNANLNYTIIEIPSFIKNIKRYQEKEINYRSKILPTKIDIIICCSVFQYVDDWKKNLTSLLKHNMKYVFFADMFLGNIKSFVTLQNYYESKIPHWFLNFNEFNEFMKNNGYKLKLKKKMITKRLNFDTKISMDNFDQEDRIPYTLNLLYEKI